MILNIGLVETLFALLVFAAVLAVMVDTYAEVVVAAALLVAIWKLFQFTGPSLILAVVLIIATAGLKLGVDFLSAMLDTDTEGTRDVVTFLDAFVTRHDDADAPERRQHRIWTNDQDHGLDTDVDSIEDYRR